MNCAKRILFNPVLLLSLCLLWLPTAGRGAAAARIEASNWRTDPAWYQGKAEWALYDAVRPIYGQPRRYEATIFTNKQRMDLATTTKADGPSASNTIEVFKHNVSEMIPTENYTYRFLTTCFVETETLEPYKLAVSTQEDCGTTYKQLLIRNEQVEAVSFCYFPGAGSEQTTYRRPGEPRNFAFQDQLTLTLRDYPFDAPQKPARSIKLVPDQTDTHQTSPRPEEATVTYVGKEKVTVPYGELEVHHLHVEPMNRPAGGTSDYWFAADPSLRHVLVKYAGPFGVSYELKRLDWWAYWAEPRPE